MGIQPSPHATIFVPGMKSKEKSPFQMAVRRFLYNKLAVLGVVVLLLLVLMSIMAPLLTHWSPTQLDLMNAGSPPMPGHWLGTNNSGTDNWAVDVYGGRADLGIGFGCTVVVMYIGIFLGGLAGYYGGWIDAVIMRICDFMMNFPFLLLIIVITAVVNVQSSWILMATMGLVGWPGIARYIRGLFLNLRDAEYVLASKIAGCGVWRIIFRHMLPNVIGPVVVQASFTLAGYVTAVAGLALIGFGVPPSTPSWGGTLSQALDFITLQSSPLLWLPPMIFLTAAVLSINFIGDGLRDAFDPSFEK